MKKMYFGALDCPCPTRFNKSWITYYIRHIKQLTKVSYKERLATKTAHHVYVFFSAILQFQNLKSISLIDIVSDLHRSLLNMTLSSKALLYLLAQLADIEVRLSTDASEKVQLAGLVGVFYNAREMLE